MLRRIAEEVRARLDGVKNISRTGVVGGRPLEVRVEMSSEDASARGVTGLEVGEIGLGLEHLDRDQRTR